MSANTSANNLVGEILCEKQENRFVLFPIKYQEIYKKYKDAVATFWTVEEIDLSRDLNDWNELNNNETTFIKNIIAFFAGSDGIVMENLAQQFMKDIEIPEVRQFYSYQIFNEAIHSETYSLLIDTYVTDETEKNNLFDAINMIPCIKKKATWAMKWMSPEFNFGQRLIGFAIVEGLFFSSSFCAIYWLKKRGLMPGLCFSNELISRDEGMHTDFACLLYSMISNKVERDTVNSMFKEAVEIEKEFIIDSIPCAMIGMNSTLMSHYIEFVADRLLVQLGYEKIYQRENPFEFMEMISLRPKSNFFEVRVGEYKKANVASSEFSINEDF
jgi:ribonucleoside-diphosphate reductase beta chain